MNKNYHKPIIELRQSLTLLKDQEVITDKVLGQLNNLISNISENIPNSEDYKKNIPYKTGMIRFKDKSYKITVESF